MFVSCILIVARTVPEGSQRISQEYLVAIHEHI